MLTVIFAICALTSFVCAALLLRAYAQTHTRLLLWSGLCFAGLFLNNLLLLIDKRVVPSMDLSVWRSMPALAGIGLLIYGLVWDAQK